LKLLGLRICAHDSNFSYFDGEKVHYLKTERKFQIKHHGMESLTTWQDVIKEEWDITSEDLDEIAIVFDPWQYDLNIRNESFFPAVDIHDLNVKCPVVRLNHHYAHHLSCWPLIKNPQNYRGICIDGFGDYDKSWTVFDIRKIIEQGSKFKNGSIGVEMSRLRNVFQIQGHGEDIAGKVMALQSFGNIDYKYLNFLSQYTMYDISYIFNIDFYCDKIEKQKFDWLRTIHEYLGFVLLQYFKKHFDVDETILYTGGAALNVCWNTKLKSYFKNIITPPHTADEGLSLGALEYLRLKNNLPCFKLNKFPFCQSDESPKNKPSKNIISKTAELLKEQKIVGWYQGNGEIGPRALGNRSIFADPRDTAMKKKVNLIKKREEYRPFGCTTIDTNFNKSDYMLYAEKINSKIYPAISHIDNTCRHQTIDYNFNTYYLLKEFYKLTDCTTLLNTSLNINGNPLAAYTKNAKDILTNSELDALVIGDEIFIK